MRCSDATSPEATAGWRWAYIFVNDINPVLSARPILLVLGYLLLYCGYCLCYDFDDYITITIFLSLPFFIIVNVITITLSKATQIFITIVIIIDIIRILVLIILLLFSSLL